MNMEKEGGSMTTEAQAVLGKALELDAVERAELIEAIFRSFDKTGSGRGDALWAKEAESRIDAFDAGMIVADSADAVFNRISSIPALVMCSPPK